MPNIFNDEVFIHRSIKTRIETAFVALLISGCDVFIHRSIKTRIETQEETNIYGQLDTVFIHRSIKTRIETHRVPERVPSTQCFYT
mgnify:FL=1